MSDMFNLSKNQVQTYKMLFELIDKRGNQKISVDDLKETFKDLKIPIEESQIEIEMLENSNAIDFNQFVTLLSSKFTRFSDETELKDAFATFAENNVVDSKILKNGVLEGIDNTGDKVVIGKIVDEFTRENKITGFNKFETDEFIDRVKQ